MLNTIYFLLNLYLTFSRNYLKNYDIRIKRIFIRIINVVNIIENYFIMLKIIK